MIFLVLVTLSDFLLHIGHSGCYETLDAINLIVVGSPHVEV